MYASKGVKNYMGDNAQPIVETTNEWIALDYNLDHPILPTRRSKTGFQVFCNFFEVRTTAILINNRVCGGWFCDAQDMFRNGQIRNRCSCIQMNARVGSPIVSIDLRLTPVADGGQAVIDVDNFTSKYFLKTFVFTGPFPPNLQASLLRHVVVQDQINDALDNLFEEITEWRVFG